MNIIQKQRDGYDRESDYKNKYIYKKEKHVFQNSYRYLILSGYIPKTWPSFKLPKNTTINITIAHKRLS